MSGPLGVYTKITGLISGVEYIPYMMIYSPNATVTIENV